MAYQVEKVREDRVAADETAPVVERERVTTAEVSPATTAARIVWYIAGIILVILALRFILVLLGANQSNGFVNFIYSISYPFAAPFFGIFGYTLQYGVSRFEISTLVAMAIYALIAWGLARLFTLRRP